MVTDDESKLFYVILHGAVGVGQVLLDFSIATTIVLSARITFNLRTETGKCTLSLKKILHSVIFKILKYVCIISLFFVKLACIRCVIRFTSFNINLFNYDLNDN